MKTITNISLLLLLLLGVQPVAAQVKVEGRLSLGAAPAQPAASAGILCSLDGMPEAMRAPSWGPH